MLNWAKIRVDSLKNTIKATRDSLNSCMDTIDNPQFGEKITYKEEIHWQQRSRNNWLAAGDRNTAYFHKTATEQRRHNNICSLKNEQGTLMTEQKDIEEIIINYYDSLFSTSNPSNNDIHNITNHIVPTVSPETNNSLLLLFTKEEIKKALFNLNPS